MALYKMYDEKTLGKKILLNAVKMEESLIDLLRLELKTLKKKAKEETNTEDIQKILKTIKYILITLTIMDDRIQIGLELMKK